MRMQSFKRKSSARSFTNEHVIRYNILYTSMALAFPKTFDASLHEEKLYQLWEDKKAFQAVIDKDKKPFTIILPLPNANDPMHIGHAMFVIEDILTRYHIMRGDPTLWIPGADHAGMETQYMFEKKLAKEGKSRFDFDRETL